MTTSFAAFSDASRLPESGVQNPGVRITNPTDARMDVMSASAVRALVLAGAPQNAPSDAAQPGASLARIRELLARRPPVLKITAPEPTYKVEVIQHPYFTTPPFVWTFAGGGVPLAQRQTDAASPLIS